MGSAAFVYIPLRDRIAFKKERGLERREWLERQWAKNPRCHYCKNKTELKPRDHNQRADHCSELFATLDHVVPVARGGIDRPANWRLACAPCNALKGTQTEREYINDLIAAGVRAR